MESRRYTNKLWDFVESGRLDAKRVLGVALQCMSEAEVKDMCDDDFMQVGWELGDGEVDEEDEDAEDESVPEPAPVEAVLALLEGAGLTCYANCVEYEGPCVILVTKSNDSVMWNSTAKIQEIDALLEPAGWELGKAVAWPVFGTHERETLWTLVPLKKES